MYDNPFDGQDEYAKVSAIVGMCTDENGYADIDDVMALASSAGLCEDYGLLEFATQENNEHFEDY